MLRKLLLALVVIVAGINPVISTGSPLLQVQLAGCGDYFAIASLGLEARIQGTRALAGYRYVTVGVMNVSSRAVELPIQTSTGVWGMVTESLNIVTFDAQRSLGATITVNDGQLELVPRSQGILELVFPSLAAGQNRIINSELGGELVGDGVPICDATGVVETEPPPTTFTPAAPANRVSSTATVVPRRSTATVAPSFGTTVASSSDIALALLNAPWLDGEYVWAPPTSLLDFCVEGFQTVCVVAESAVGAVILIVPERIDHLSAIRANLLQGFPPGERLYHGYSYSFSSGLDSSDGIATAVGTVGSVIIVSFGARAEAGGARFRFTDPDINAVLLMEGAIARVERLLGL